VVLAAFLVVQVYILYGVADSSSTASAAVLAEYANSSRASSPRVGSVQQILEPLKLVQDDEIPVPAP